MSAWLFGERGQSYGRWAYGSGLGKHNGKDALGYRLRRSSNTNWGTSAVVLSQWATGPVARSTAGAHVAI
jgi:hypothetical protein